jgi:hypothetical protein
MAKFCTKCGKPLKEGTKFCTECGEKIEASAKPAPAPAPQPVQQPAPAYTPPPAKKSKTGLIIAIIAIIVAIVIIVLVVFFVLGGGGVSESTLVGAWDVETYGVSWGEWTFHQNGSLEMVQDLGGLYQTTEWTTWSVSDGKLYFAESSGSGVPVETGMTIVTSNGGNSVTLKYTNPYGGGEVTVTLTKK